MKTTETYDFKLFATYTCPSCGEINDCIDLSKHGEFTAYGETYEYEMYATAKYEVKCKYCGTLAALILQDD